MVIGGYDEYDGLLSVALKLAGQSAEVVMALGAVLPEPPVGAGVGGGRGRLGGGGRARRRRLLPLVEDEVGRCRPPRGHDANVMNRRVFCRRLAAFCSASSRACRPAFWR
jgi:hypothetical protein